MVRCSDMSTATGNATWLLLCAHRCDGCTQVVDGMRPFLLPIFFYAGQVRRNAPTSFKPCTQYAGVHALHPIPKTWTPIPGLCPGFLGSEPCPPPPQRRQMNKAEEPVVPRNLPDGGTEP